MRASYEASVSEQVIHAETAWYDRGYEQGYAQGRRDALRGVQGACLFEAGDGNPFFTSDEDAIRGVALLDVAKAAEEAAR